MADRHVDYLLIGGGLAAGNCARWLRESGADGSILLVGREPDLPYNRPPCSKEYLQGKELARGHPVPAARVVRRSSRSRSSTRTSAMKLDTGARSVTLSNKEEVSFDKALVATGANVRRLNVPGCELEGIHYLRTLGNSDTIREDAAGKRVVLIGGSYIAQRGRRVADRARQLVHDGDARAGRAEPRLRRAGRAVLPGPARASTASPSTATTSSTASRAPTAASRGSSPRRARARRRRRRDRHGRRARRDARPRRRARARRERWRSTSTRGCRSQRARDLRGRRHRRVRERRARRPADPRRALGRRVQSGQDGRAEHARPRPAARRRALLLLRPVRLGLARVRRPGLATGIRRSSAARSTSGEFSVWYVRAAASRRRCRSDARTISSTRGV